MKAPQTPRPFRELMIEATQNKNFDEILKVAGEVPSRKLEYLHWDDMRHRKPPGILTPEQWWVAAKLRRKPGFPEKFLLLTGGSQGELVTPYHLPRGVLAFVDGHSVMTPYARFSVEVQSASRRCAPSFRKRAW